MNDEIQRLNNRIPKLELRHGDGAQHRIFILEQANQLVIDDGMIRIMRIYHEYDTDNKNRSGIGPTEFPFLNQINQINSMLGSYDLWSNAWSLVGKTRYNAELPKFYERYEKYLSSLYYFRSHVLSIDLMLDNTGTCAADDVMIQLELPAHLDVRDQYNVPVEPEPPKEPQPDENRYYISTFHSSIYRNLSQHSVILPEPNITGPNLEASNMISFYITKARQHVSYNFDPFYIVFDDLECVKNFKIAYTIIADNIPDKIIGILDVVIGRT